MYRPAEAAQMTTPLKIQKPIISDAYGVQAKKEWVDVAGEVWANFKTYGGTERTDNGVLSVEDTATIVCWFRPDITGACRVIRLTDGAAFEILGEPENIEMRNQFLKFKVRRVKGGA